MKDDRLEYDVQKRSKAGTAATARAAVALYVIWLGVKIIRGVIEGDTTMSPAVGWTAGIVFIAASLAFGFYIWKRWRADMEAARLPAAQEGEDAGADAPDA